MDSALRYNRPVVWNGRPIRSWAAFQATVKRPDRPLLATLDDYRDPILVAGCQRSSTTALARLLKLADGIVDHTFGHDDELDGAVLLAGHATRGTEGRHCFQTTYLNDRLHEYFEHRGFRLIWMLREPRSVVYSMLNNWKRGALNRLFEARGAEVLAQAGERATLGSAWLGPSRLAKARGSPTRCTIEASVNATGSARATPSTSTGFARACTTAPSPSGHWHPADAREALHSRARPLGGLDGRLPVSGQGARRLSSRALRRRHRVPHDACRSHVHAGRLSHRAVLGSQRVAPLRLVLRRRAAVPSAGARATRHHIAVRRLGAHRHRGTLRTAPRLQDDLARDERSQRRAGNRVMARAASSPRAAVPRLRHPQRHADSRAAGVPARSPRRGVPERAHARAAEFSSDPPPIAAAP